MQRLETPGDRPIHDAAGIVPRRIGRRIATARNERRRIHAINLPIDWLNRLALRDVIVAAGPTVCGGVAHGLELLRQRFANEERVGSAIGYIREPNEGAASRKHPARIFGDDGRAPREAGLKTGMRWWVKR